MAGPPQPSRYAWTGSAKGEHPAVTLQVTKKPGENAVQVAERVLARAAELRGTVIPHEVQVSVTRNYGATANDKAQQLIKKLLFATLSVIVLVLVALGWREALIVGIAVLLTLAASQTWRSRLLALGFAAPHMLHAVLGTRRGPAFVTAFLLVGGLYIFRGRRPPVLATLAGGTAVGLLLLFLLANRQRVYYGSEKPLTFDLTDSIAFNPNAGNDHVVAAGLVTTADRMGRFGWGVSYVEQMFLRPIPRELLPDKYELLEPATVGAEDVGATLGWRPLPGWSPTLFAHLYIEFGWLSAAASFLLGWSYGWVWRRSVESGAVGWLVLNVLLCAGLLHLMAQDFWAMAVPLLLMFVPAWAALRWALDRPFLGPDPATGTLAEPVRDYPHGSRRPMSVP